jgi:hypothetical protein
LTLDSDQGNSVNAQIVDTCTSCGEFDLNFSPAAFSELAKLSVGRIRGVSWFVVGAAMSIF